MNISCFLRYATTQEKFILTRLTFLFLRFSGGIFFICLLYLSISTLISVIVTTGDIVYIREVKDARIWIIDIVITVTNVGTSNILFSKSTGSETTHDFLNAHGLIGLSHGIADRIFKPVGAIMLLIEGIEFHNTGVP